MDKKETTKAYDEEAVDRAIEGMGMWCALHKSDFLDKAWASFGALCGDEVDFDGCEGIAQALAQPCLHRVDHVRQHGVRSWVHR